jgi:hypothetical protein
VRCGVCSQTTKSEAFLPVDGVHFLIEVVLVYGFVQLFDDSAEGGGPELTVRAAQHKIFVPAIGRSLCVGGGSVAVVTLARFVVVSLPV